jgi:hypothetical protein
MNPEPFELVGSCVEVIDSILFDNIHEALPFSLGRGLACLAVRGIG